MATANELEQKAWDAFVEDNFNLAVALYTQAIAVGPPTAGALYADRAQAGRHTHIKLRNFAAAAKDATSVDPAMHRAYLRRALVCIRLEQYESARAAVEAGAALAPGDARFAQLLNELNRGGGGGWDKHKLEAQVKKEDEKVNGDEFLLNRCDDLYREGDDDMRRAMTKSIVESKGTVILTNWEEVDPLHKQ
ncbi:hypothetical protein E2562_000857 [Oryza meyeriana var. granulata]|uniref:SGS domain-containing protein n=1 Tax=Oryza meyeriana var. granulata TaxID=110450 RepID=A0A6G1CY81_9ORYZ|nr:hypothetical protein E2562_000857 [Oryza meyeriana var. granulata]